MKSILNTLLNIYKEIISYSFSLIFGKGCKFHPTCSEYTKIAINKYGPLKGTLLGLRRIMRCRPGTSPGYDPVK